MAAAFTALGIATTSLALAFAGLPVSAVFAVLGGEFVIAWPVDAMVWIVVGWLVARRGRRRVGSLVVVIAVALAYGWAMSLLVEPVASF